MKKLYLTILTFGICLVSQAQVTLTKAANEPVIGDMEMYNHFDTTTVLNNASGTNQSWNFTSLTLDTIISMTTYTTPASTPNGTLYPSATLAGNDGVGGYTYTKSTLTQYELVGMLNTNVAISLSNTAVAAVWPVNYGYTNTDAFAGSINSGTISGTVNGTLTTTGTGTGTLTLPGGTVVNNVLQLKNTQVLSASLMMGLYTFTITSTNYNYYSATQKFPVLSVEYKTTTGAINDYEVTIKVNSNLVTGIEKQSLNHSLVIYPNPVKDHVTVSFTNLKNETPIIQILNLYGQTVKEVNIANNLNVNETISTSELASGVYFVKTTLGKETAIKKLIVQ